MNTRLRGRIPIHYRGEPVEQRDRENAYSFCLVVDDGDYEHDEDGQYAFPCTRQQLMALRRQINELLGRATEVMR